jgi:hypothetical protein
MAKEHHCPNDGPQPCNASTSRIHTCGLCNATWEEDLSGPPAPATAAPAAKTPPIPPTTIATPRAPAAPTTSSSSPNSPPAAAKPPVPATVATGRVSTSNPVAPATPAPAARSPGPIPTAATQPAPTPDRKPGPPPPPPGVTSRSLTYQDELVGSLDGLEAKIATAKVKTCPVCHSPDLAQPSQSIAVGGRIALGDSQSYRVHWWFADTGDAYVPPITKVAMKASA